MVKLTNCLIGITCATLVAGCSAIQVATFHSSPNSFQRKAERVSMALVGPDSAANKTGMPTLGEMNITGPDAARIRAQCGLPPPPGTANTEVFAVAGLIVALAGVVIDAGIAKLSEYAERKSKEFTHTYSVRLNVPSLFLPREAGERGPPRTTCLFVQRDVSISDDEAIHYRPALSMVLQFVPLGTQAYYLRPIYLDVAYAGARTSAAGNAIDIDVSVGIAVVKDGGGAGSVADLIAHQSYSLRKIRLRGAEANRPDYTAKFEDGTIIPSLAKPASATIVVAVTETGDGADDFGQLKKDTEAYGKVVKDFGLEQLKSALGAK
jgi:hypothetical protein